MGSPNRNFRPVTSLSERDWCFFQINIFFITITSQSHQYSIIMSVPRMSSLLSARKCKTMDTEGDSFQAITNDLSNFMEKSENKIKDGMNEDNKGYFISKGITDFISTMDGRFLNGVLSANMGNFGNNTK